MPTIRDILRNKGPQVHTIPVTATVLEAVHTMNQHRIGSLIVMEDAAIAGMFTERDILRRVIEEQRRPSEIPISEVMTREVIYTTLDTSIEDASRIMKDLRVRHIPVADEQGRLIGIISIGDLNAFHASAQEATIHSLHDYLYGHA